MRVYVGVTDGEWYRFLAARGATEVNFWQPSGGRQFAAIPKGAPFLFKTHFPHNRIVGGGFLSGWASLPVSRAWEFFGDANGCADEAEMRRRVLKYRRKRGAAVERDPEVGCIMLRDVKFFMDDEAFDAPENWARNIVQGRTYDAAEIADSPLEQALTVLLAGPSDQAADGVQGRPTAVAGEVFGTPREVPVRVGQRAFKALVQEAYQRRCAVTGDKIVPVLEAAHIRPVTAAGQNRVDNGLLLRSDVHTLFDRGYLSVHPAKRTLLVSPRLRGQWGNGEEFYQRAASGVPITVPSRRADRPNRNYLEWHADAVFMAT